MGKKLHYCRSNVSTIVLLTESRVASAWELSTFWWKIQYKLNIFNSLTGKLYFLLMKPKHIKMVIINHQCGWRNCQWEGTVELNSLRQILRCLSILFLRLTFFNWRSTNELIVGCQGRPNIYGALFTSGAKLVLGYILFSFHLDGSTWLGNTSGKPVRSWTVLLSWYENLPAKLVKIQFIWRTWLKNLISLNRF